MPNSPHHEESQVYTSLLLLLAEAMKKSKIRTVQITSQDVMQSTEVKCPIRIIQGKDPNDPFTTIIRAELLEPPTPERKRIITLD